MTARLRVRVHPGGRRERITGWRPDGALALEVRAAAEGGRANDAVVRLLSQVLGVGRAAVRVAGGETSRSKWIEIEGLTMAEIETRVAAAAAAEERGRGR